MAKAVIIIGEALMHLGCIYAELLGTMPMLAQAAGGGILREKAPDSGSMLIAERQCETVIDSAYGPHGISNHVLMCQIDDQRSEERRVGKEGAITCISRWWPAHKTKNNKKK